MPNDVPPVVAPRLSGAIPFFARDHLRGMSMEALLTPKRSSYAVVVKATCDIDPTEGTVALREEGEPLTGDEHTGDPPMSSLRYPSDLAVVKAYCDVMLWGYAHSKGRPSVDLRFAFGDMSKTRRGFDRRLRAYGQRGWVGRSPATAEPFDTLPLMWELAAAQDSDNPVGRSSASPLAHQIELVDGKGPAGFGAIPMMWPARRRHFGTYDMRWYDKRYPCFAEDLDPSAFQAAPQAQQLDHISGGESFVLEGMHADHRVIEGQLPGLRAQVFAVGPSPDGGKLTEVSLRLDTVFFDAEARTVALVWRGLHDVIDDRGSDVSAWFGQLVDAEASPTEQEVQEVFWALYPSDQPESERVDVTPEPEVAAAPSPLEIHDARVRQRLQAAGMPAALFSSGETLDEKPPTEPPPRRWLPADEDPARRAVEAWLRGGDAPDPESLAGAELSGLDLSGRRLTGWILRGAHLAGCCFEEADLSQAELGEAVAPDASFVRARLDRADLSGASLEGASFAGASLIDANLEGAEAERATFDEVTATGAQLVAGNFAQASFRKAKLDSAALSESNLRGACFASASMCETRLYDADAAGADLEGADLTEARADGVILTGAVCNGASADDAVLDGADLTDVTWCKASLRSVSLVGVKALRARFLAVDMRGARMSESALNQADFRASNLMEADLGKSDLSGADVRDANLFGAELFGATLDDLNRERTMLGRTILESK